MTYLWPTVGMLDAEYKICIVLWYCIYLCVQGEMTLGLLVENCGRVNYGPGLDNQRKGIVKYLFLILLTYCRYCSCGLLLLPVLCPSDMVLMYWMNFIFIDFSFHAGLVGDITLNDVPLKQFTMHCLDMKPSYINRLAVDDTSICNFCQTHSWRKMQKCSWTFSSKISVLSGSYVTLHPKMEFCLCLLIKKSCFCWKQKKIFSRMLKKILLW